VSLKVETPFCTFEEGVISSVKIVHVGEQLTNSMTSNFIHVAEKLLTTDTKTRKGKFSSESWTGVGDSRYIVTPSFSKYSYSPSQGQIFDPGDPFEVIVSVPVTLTNSNFKGL
jgi:hypothetical protein